MENKKQNISVRVSTSDLKKIKDIAKRLNVRESDVFRFAIKGTLARLAPLCEKDQRGSDLMPLLMEYGTELANYFGLDSDVLEAIVNLGVETQEKQVDKKDIELLTLSSMQENYLYLKLKERTNTQIENNGINAILKDYLYKKYFENDAGITQNSQV
jgi:hypothetical protein